MLFLYNKKIESSIKIIANNFIKYILSSKNTQPKNTVTTGESPRKTVVSEILLTSNALK
jgi:hypothetical protein